MAHLPATRPARFAPRARTRPFVGRRQRLVAAMALLSAMGGAAVAVAPPAAAAPPAIDYNFDFIGQDRATGGFGGGSLAGFRRGTGTGHGPYTDELTFRYVPVLSNPVGFDIRHTVGPCAGRSDRYQTLGVVADAPPSWSGTYPTRTDGNGCLLPVNPIGALDQPGQSSVSPNVLTVAPHPETGAPLARVVGYAGDWFWPSSPPTGKLEGCDRVAQRCQVTLKELDLQYSADTDFELVLTGYKEQFAANTEPLTPTGSGEIVLARGAFSGPESILTVPFVQDGRLPQSDNILAQGSLPAYSSIVTDGRDFRAKVELRVLDVDAYNNFDQLSTVSSVELTDRPAPPTGTPTVGPPTRSGPPLAFRPLPGPPARQTNVVDPPGPVDPTPPVGQPDVVPVLPQPPEQLPLTGLLNRCSSEACEVTDLRFPDPTGRVRLVNATNGTFIGDAEVSGTAGRIYFPADAQASPGDLVRAEGFDTRTGEWVPLANTVPVGTTNTLPGFQSAMRCTADNPTLPPRGTCKATIVDTDAAPGAPLNVCLYAVALPGQAASRKVGCSPTDAAGLVQFPDHGMAAATEFWVSVVDIPPSTSFDTTQREVFLAGRTLTPRFGRN